MSTDEPIKPDSTGESLAAAAEARAPTRPRAWHSRVLGCLGRAVRALLILIIVGALVLLIPPCRKRARSLLPFEDQWRSPERAAHVLVNDRKFGMRGVPAVIEFGDDALRALREQIEDSKRLDNRNSEWIAEVLSTIRTQTSREIAEELYARDDARARLVGTVALAVHGALPDTERAYTQLEACLASPMFDDFAELSLMALGHLPPDRSLPVIRGVLEARPAAYWRHARACQALQQLNDPAAISILRECLGASDFHALPDAFVALVSLGDVEAIPLAIARIHPDLDGYNSGFVVEELERVTGESHGFDHEDWQSWWDAHGATWKIPPEFVGVPVERWR